MVNPEESMEITEMVCLESDLLDGQMKEVEVDKHKILLVKNEGQFSAVGSRCSHYGAPLVKGTLLGDRVRCPFHGACFNVKTGDIEEYPGLDSLPSYKVKTEDGKVYVTVNTKETKRIREMSHRVPEVCHTVVLIGGGPASLVCAETLRQNDYSGRIIMVTKEGLPPFDKPKLSKAMNVDSERLLLRPKEFFQQHDIELWMKKEVISVDTEAKTVTMDDNTAQHYDQLLIATGCRARPMACPGADLENVRLLESFQDAQDIHNLCAGKKAVVVGTSFIGMEVAAYLSDKATSVSIIGRSEYPFQLSLGSDIGKMTMQMLEEKDVKFYMKNNVAEILGENGKVKEVLLQNGGRLEADVVVFGIGVLPNVDFLKGSKIATDQRNNIIVDKCMKTSVPEVFSAGDVVSFPLAMRGDERVSIGHWQLAHAHGRIAGLSMVKKPTEINSVPFFWTVLLGKSIRYTGYGQGYTDIVFKGKVEERKFLAFYLKDDVVVAAASLNFDPAVACLAEMIANGKVITRVQIESDDLGWLQLP
ncbi:apoptosis inducing factor mitochondria associated 4 [Clupea harengus]|uniref:Apoptosis inducing factor mitochondria associated 4 n=1 Tax=Clupea harengus TaxID=7950 RepID=A0A6P8FLE3_CLUHA|nr:apoptosis inducing factor mitochondria associated 4 [Clupea harengus]XP_031429053.1 apoptosis inducing factor mitochondria associated 4 [Clupea harengus]XP_031429054.1 apoptosis inducing factor mitochondria associated 4 [Clupea harengus]XP_031429055.1 apoptosis inducing factor mitochondria associated 4 [Clupea harengus]